MRALSTSRRLLQFLGMCSVCAVLLGCGVPRSGADDGDDYDPNGVGAEGRGDECQSSDVRCEAGTLKTCFNGRWRIKTTCLPEQVCDVGLGCVDCSPNLDTACDGDDVRHCDSAGHFGSVVLTCDPGLCKGGECANSCGKDADLIYIVDESYRLLSFNPRDDKNEIKLIGNLNCPANMSWEGGAATPFSMSVDRDATAWVLYNSGEIFWVSTKDASCKPSGFMPGQLGFQTFGMGFVSDAVGTDSETLFISGGSYLTPGKGNLGSVNKASLMASTRGVLPDTEYGPELTGTGKTELYGYFPGSPTFVARFDKDNGGIAQMWPLPAVTDSVQAWAFAHWGGRFYVFITTLDSGTFMENSRILLFTPDDGMLTPILDHLPYKIVGAGVSTCAPVVIG